MTATGLPEGTPIVCRNCGGGMDLLADASIACRYCGARDHLPADELGRVLEIKNRLAQAEQRAAHVKGFDANFASVFENPASFLRVMGAYLLFGLLILVMSSYSVITGLLPDMSKLDTATIVQVGLGQLMAPIGILGFAGSLGMSLLTGRRHYRRHVRPLLVAARPAQPNAPFRCRACGGNLPPARGSDAPCPYCRALNLVPQELHGSHAAALFNEAEAARQQLFRAQGAIMSISAKMRTTLILCGAATFLCAYVLPMVGMALLK